MVDYLLLLYPTILAFIIFWNSDVSKKGEFALNLWDRKQAKMLQAGACMGVILHHVTQLITSYGQIYHGPITIFASAGILFTSIFFFFSGYGLIVSIQNNPQYLHTFFRHRIPTILIPFLGANAICVLVRIFYSKIPMSFLAIVKCIFGYVLLNGNGWYIIEIFFLYIIFYLLFRCVKNNDLALGLLCLATILLIFYSFNQGHDYSDIGDLWFKGEWWFNSTIVFVMGILFARFREKIINFSKKHYRFLLSLTSILFVIAFIIEEKILNVYGYYHETFDINRINEKAVTLIAQMILCIIFTYLVLLINMKITLNNRVLQFISMISMELFLLHGLFVRTIFDFKGINYFWIYGIVIVCAVPSAVIVHLINAPIINFINNISLPQKYHTEGDGDLLRQRHEKKVGIIKKTVLIIIISVIGSSALLSIYYKVVKVSKDYKKELLTIESSSIGDTVCYGYYECDFLKPGKEKVEWIVLEKNNDYAMLLSKYGLTGSTYNTKHTSVKWLDSSLCQYLNTTMYDDLFSEKEKESIMANPETGDYVSLLSVNEANDFFLDDKNRELALTRVAENEGTNLNTMSKVRRWDMKGYRSSWWWLRGSEESAIAPIVSVDGEVLLDNKYVNKPKGAVRPVIFINLNGAKKDI